MITKLEAVYMYERRMPYVYINGNRDRPIKYMIEKNLY